MNKSFHRLVTGLLLVAVTLVASAQEILQLGDLSYSRAPAPSLQRRVDFTPGFFRGVGGVAFDAVAAGDSGLAVTDLRYEPERPDGQRLAVDLRTADGREVTVHPSLHDWALVPIAHFAASPDGSAMTLFGSLEDAAFEAAVLATGGRAINYHPALDNTLLGLRLMQADILLFEPAAADLPRNAAGYVLGAGEAAPDVAANTRRFDAVQRLLASAAEGGEGYRSYVVGDLDQQVRFRLEESDQARLVFTGRPYWTMWRYPAAVETALEFFGLVEAANAGDFRARLLLSLQHDEPADIEQAMLEHQATLRRWQATGAGIEVNEDLSERVSAEVAARAGINPVVYAALTRVMHYRALFRHALERDPAGYRRFLSSLDGVRPTPTVTTPTVQRPRRPH